MSELFTRNGEVMITRQQRALLLTIWEAPACWYPSMTRWADDAQGHLQGSSRKNLRRCAGRMPESWVSRTREFGAKACRLERRGRDIIEGRIPVWVRGSGRLAQDFANLERGVESLGRMSLGQLLEWLEEVHRLAEDESDPERAAHYRSRLVDGEIVLAHWKPRPTRPPNFRGKWGTWKIRGQAQRAARAGDVGRFAHAVRMLSSLEWAAKQALSFSKPGQRRRALEEVVLLAEVRATGLFETRRRRMAHADRQEMELQKRLVDALASAEARREE